MSVLGPNNKEREGYFEDTLFIRKEADSTREKNGLPSVFDVVIDKIDNMVQRGLISESDASGAVESAYGREGMAWLLGE